MHRACELKDQTYKKTRTLHFSEFVRGGLTSYKKGVSIANASRESIRANRLMNRPCIKLS